MGYEFDDDPARVDRDALWAFLSTEAYWGRWRTRTQLEQQVAVSWRVIGCYDASSGAMVGFARALSDGVAFAFLSDVYVLAAHRGRGLGKRLVATMIEAGPGADYRWLLNTDDAHRLYAGFGFGQPAEGLMERPLRLAE